MKRAFLFLLFFIACASPLTVATTREFVLEDDAAQGTSDSDMTTTVVEAGADEDATAEIHAFGVEAGSDAKNEQ